MHPAADGDIGASSQLACAIINYAGGEATENVIFVTRNAEYNQVTLQIALTSGSTVLSPGTIPDPLSPPGPDDGTTIYVDLRALGLSEQAWEQLTFRGEGWAFRTFPHEGVVGMTPSTAPIPLSSGTAGAIPIGIGGVVVPEAPSVPQVQVYVIYYNIPAVAGMYTTFAVALQNAPEEREANLSEAIGASLSANGIINTPGPLLRAANQFALQFTNLGRLVPAGPSTTFSVSFVYGASGDDYGFGALTTVARAIEFSVKQGDNADGWTITPDNNSQAVTWTLRPPDGAPIVGTGAQSVVTIDFSNVVTPYQPGPTVMLVSYSDVPGYKNGTYTLLLNKIPHVMIGSLEVSPNPTYFDARGSAKVTVRWDVADAQSLELTQNYLTTPVTGQTKLDATLQAESTVFALRATGRPGTVENSDYQTVQAIALPVINSFAGAPTEIYHGTLAHDASLDWAVNSASDVRLYSTGGAFDGQSFRPVDKTSASIFETQMVTLTPRTVADPVTLTRRLVFSAFRPSPERHELPFTPKAAVASPTGPFVVLAGPATSLTVVDTVEFATASSYALGHAASDLVFSADGTLLATANADKTVSVLKVDLGATGLPSFENLSTLTLSETPHRLVFTPDGQRVFATLEPDGDGPGRLLSLVRSGNGFAIEGPPVSVGRKPRGLTLDAAGARLFVANSGETTLTMIGLTRDGKPGSTTTIRGFTGGPTGIAATPSGRQLLVSCGTLDGTTGTVIAVDPDYPELGQRNPLPVGGSPGQIALLPSGSYAAVANGKNGTISLIDCWGQPVNARIPGPPVAVGSRPGGIAASPDGLQVLVAVEGGFCVVTLATYQSAGDPVDIPNYPTTVAVSPDGESVFAWHDAGIPARSPTRGVLVYDPSSRTTANLLADREVLRLVASPDPLAKEAFAVIKDDQALYRVSTEDLEVTRYPLGLAAGFGPAALAISGEGRTVFVVAANASRDLSLTVLEWQDISWTVTQSLPLYRASAAGRVLARSTPDGATLLLVDIAAAQVRVLRRVGADYVLSPAKITGDVRALDIAVLPDGSTAYVLNSGQQGNTITVIDVASLDSRVAAVPQAYVRLTGLQPSPDGRRLFAPDTSAAALRMLDPRSLRIVQTIPLAARPGTITGISGLAVAPDGSAIFTANTDSQNVSVVEQIQMGTTADRPRPQRTRAAAYSGLFLRHYLGEKPGSPRNGWSACPDVIPFGLQTAPPAHFTTPAQYAKDLGVDVTLNNDNNVYIRGYNAGTASITSRVYFYYTAGSLALWPANWRSDKVTVNTVEQNWIDVTAPANGAGVGDSPLVWVPDYLNPATDHYCVIGWAVDGPNPQPPDFDRYNKFATLDDLVNFIVTHHNMGWRNTRQYAAPAPSSTYSTALSTLESGASVYITIKFKDLPIDGDFAVSMQGTDEENTISQPRTSLSRYLGGYQPPITPLALPGDFSTSLRVSYWKGNTPVPDTGQIKVSLLVALPPALIADIERLYRPTGLRTPIQRYGTVPVFELGTAQFEFKFKGQ